MLTGEISDKVVSAVVFLIGLFLGFCGASNFPSF